MTHIDAGISLLSVECGVGVHSVYNVGKGDKFLITTKKSIAVFRAPDPKPIQSWMSKPSFSFSCPAVYNEEKDEFVALTNQKQIYQWSSDNATPFKQKPITLKSPVCRILSVGAGHILLTINGSLWWLDSALASPRGAPDGPLREGEEIQDAWLWQREDGEKDCGASSHVMCLVHQSKGNHHRLVILPIPRADPQEDCGDDVIRFDLEHEGSQDLSTASFHCEDSTATLYTLWKGGQVCLTTIPETCLRVRGPAQEKLTCEHKFSVAGNKDVLKISALDERHVAVAGVHAVMAKEKPEAGLSIWESTYGTLQARQPLGPQEGNDNVPLYLGQVKGHLLVATSKAVLLHRYECSRGSLASALGRLADGECREDLPILGLEWARAAEPTEKKAKGRKSKSKVLPSSTHSDGKTSALLNDILDQAKTGSKQKFGSAVKGFLDACQDSRPDSTALALALKGVVRRVEVDPKFWCAETLHDIITTKVIAASSCPEFVSLLARRQELPLLVDCLTCMKDIPEMTLVQCIQVFLSVDEGKLLGSNQSEETPMDDSLRSDAISPARRTHVDKVLTKPFTDSFLLDAVKHLQFKEVLLLLRYLHLLLTTPNAEFEDAPSRVTMDNVVDWTGILLDAHFAQLVLLPDVRPLLALLKEAVQQQVDFSRELNAVRDMLHHTQNSKSHLHSSPSAAAHSYSIKVLKI